MSAPVLTLTSASSPASSNPHLSQQPPQDPALSAIHSLATLSRNASVISTSSSSSSSSSVVAPVRPRPLRTFSNHSVSTARARSPPSTHPRSPTTPTRTSIPAAYLPRSLSPESRLAGGLPTSPVASRPGSRHTSRPPNNRSRSNSSVQKSSAPISADDFDFGDILGSGSYSSVMQATNRNTGQTYAAKIIDKAHIIRHRKTKYANIEKTCLARLGTGNMKGSISATANPKSPERNHSRKPSGLGGAGSYGHPGVIRMHWAFHDETSLYFVLDLAPNGELLTCIRRQGSLSSALTKYYTAQLVDTLAYMHDLQVLHRDVKPENILLDAERRIKITDFGSAKLLDEDKSTPSATDEEQRASSFVGSALYVSPELLMRSTAGKSSDVWALGCIIYYMIAGDAPFKSMSEYLTFEKIKKCDYTFPPDNSPEAFDPLAKDLIQKILVLDTTARYTLDQIKAHPFLASINFTTLWTDPAPPLEAGARRNTTPPHKFTVFDDDEDEDVGNIWDQFIPQQQEDDEDADEEDEAELQRVRRLGKGKAPDVAFPVVVQEVEVVEPEPEQPRKKTPPPPVRVLSSVSEEPTTPKPGLTTPKPTNSGFVVMSRNPVLPASSKALPPPPIDSTSIPPMSIPAGPASASSMTSSEGSPVDPGGTYMPPTTGTPLGLFTRVWGNKPARRGSTSSITTPALAPASVPSNTGLGLSVWSSAARRASFGSTSGKRLAADARTGSSGSGVSGGSRRMSSSAAANGGSTRSSSTSRKGSRSGSTFGARADMGKWSSIFLPGEQVIYHSPISSRTRHGLLPSKRRVLVLTDLPRLLCVKEYPDRAPATASNLPSASSGPTHTGDVVVKSEVLFSPTTCTVRPQILSKISERSGENTAAAVSGSGDGDSSSTEEVAVEPPSRRRHASFRLVGNNGPPRVALNLIKSVETKGDKSFVVRTTYKTYTYISDDSVSASQWIREIEDVRTSVQADCAGLQVGPA